MLALAGPMLQNPDMKRAVADAMAVAIYRLGDIEPDRPATVEVSDTSGDSKWYGDVDLFATALVDEMVNVLVAGG